jgi:HAD superfamily hydrolase (TIGR01509 family)
MQYKAIIFDFFDVIHNDPFQRWLKSRGLKREGEWHEASVDMDKGLIDDKEFFRRLSVLSGTPPDTLRKEFDAYNGFNDDVIRLLEILAKNYQVGLLCNGPTAFVRSLLKEGDVEDVFHHIVISSEVGMAKPNPDIFEHILAKMSVKPNDAIFIDDNPTNVEAAQKLGIHGICFTDLPSLRKSLAELGVKLS